MRPKSNRLIAAMTLPLLLVSAPAHARPARQPAPSASLASRDTTDLAEFTRKAAMSKGLGATQMSVTEGLPLATWESDPDDPYPAWFMHHATFFKIFPPVPVQPFVDMNYARRVQGIVADRCRVLARYGLNGVWSANEPAVLPEPFFVAHPEYRGPRIDHPLRSKKQHFAPNVDNEDVLAMYRESVTNLLAHCPAVDTFLWVTTDAGSGFDWAVALYPGANGNSNYRDRPISDRVVGFMTNIQQAAAAAGHPVRININQIEPRQWMIPTFGPDLLENIVRKLPRGLAVNNKEGPDGRTFESGGGRGGAGAFYPVVGLVVPSFAPVPAAGERVSVNLGDPQSVDFNYRLLKATRGMPMQNALERLTALRSFAAAEVGEQNADKLIEAWQALNDVNRYLDVLNFGGMLRFGHVLNRWVTRPMVPFPLELTPEEKADYRPYLFQARGEEQASDLADIQAMRMYEGWGARLLFQRDIELAVPRAERAKALVEQTAASAPDAAYWNLTAKRIQAMIYLMQSADNMVKYQAQLDRVNALGAKPEANPVLGGQSDWARTDMIDTARSEIDLAVNLDRLLGSTPEPVLDLAPTAGEETIMRLGPNIREALRHKVRTMNAHWRDYDRLFTIPNP
ncbi:MAG: hypothetical protein ABIQ32_09455 [Sphingomicrobium sp.]